MSSPWAGRVRFSVPPQRAYDYLVDPRNRPRWQSSLRGVELLDPLPVRAGMRWTDVTWPGLRPRMTLSTHAPPRRWVEHGTWWVVGAELALDFQEDRDGCLVGVSFVLRGPRAATPLLALLTRLARPVVLADLRRAAADLA
ncbi:MAG: SRPBCC family protein [Nocardioides sp.]|uniref:SRPBCC family protein n=1 Tax=Nocardioides sp. TaxID=35761 RepID=UPI003F0B1D45